MLRGRDPASKVIGISIKDRGAILPAGHKGTAYMYQESTGHFASSTYYMSAHPGWVDDFNAGNPAHRYFKAEWKPLLPDAAYAKSLPDSQRWYGKGGALPKTTFTASLVAGRTRSFLVYDNYDALLEYNCAHSYAITVGLLADRVVKLLLPLADEILREGRGLLPLLEMQRESRA